MVCNDVSECFLIKMINENKKSGISIIGILLLGIILIIVLSYFNVSLKAVVESPNVQNNFGYIGSAGRSLWNDYLAKPLSDIKNSAVVKYFWNSFISNMQRIHDGESTDFQKYAPTFPIDNH